MMVISKCIKSFPVKTLYNAFLLKASLLRLYYIGAVSKWTMAFSLMNLFLKRTPEYLAGHIRKMKDLNRDFGVLFSFLHHVKIQDT